MAGVGPLPWKRPAPAPREAPVWGSSVGRGLLWGHDVEQGTVGGPCRPGRGSAARARVPGTPGRRAPRGQHQLVSGGGRLQCQAPGQPPGRVWRAPGERREQGPRLCTRDKRVPFSAGRGWGQILRDPEEDKFEHALHSGVVFAPLVTSWPIASWRGWVQGSGTVFRGPLTPVWVLGRVFGRSLAPWKLETAPLGSGLACRVPPSLRTLPRPRCSSLALQPFECPGGARSCEFTGGVTCSFCKNTLALSAVISNSMMLKIATTFSKLGALLWVFFFFFFILKKIF